MHIVIVEDDLTLRQELSRLLQAHGYTCSYPPGFHGVAQWIAQRQPDLTLLDINLPGQDGYAICRELRKLSDVPVIVVTSRAGQQEELTSMNLGADDYINKPYHPQILLARIGALLKRVGRPQAQETFSLRGLTLNPAAANAAYGQKQVDLTKNEIRILAQLMSNAGRIVSRAELMEALWHTDEFVDENTLTVNINRLRRKLEELGAGEWIVTRRGQGYEL